MITILKTFDIPDNSYGSFFENFCFFNLIKKIKKEKDIQYLLLNSWVSRDKYNLNHFDFLRENNCNFVLIDKNSNLFKKIQNESEYCILTGTLDKDKFIFDNLDSDTRIFSYGLTTSKVNFNQFGRYLKIFKYLNNISFTEKNTCKYLNKSQRGLKLLQYCFNVLHPILMVDLNELLNNLGYNRKLERKYDNIFLIREINGYNKNIIQNIINEYNNSYDLKTHKDNYREIIPILLNCNTFHTTDFDVFCLGLSLRKKVVFYNKKDYRYIDIKKQLNIQTDDKENILNYEEIYKNIELERKESLSYISDVLSFKNRTYKYDDIEFLDNVKRDDTINEILKKRDNKIYINRLDRKETKEYEDISLITTFYGSRKENVNAVKLAIDLIYKYSNPLPKEWIFIEAQNSEQECQFKYIKDKYGIKYIFKKIEGCYSREFYFNYGTRFASTDKYIFIDADAIFSESDWIKEISKRLDKYDIIMPFKYFYRSNEYVHRSKTNLNSYVTISNFYRQCLNGIKYSDSYYNPDMFPGIGIGITKKTFDIINGLFISPSTMGDTPFLKQLQGRINPSCKIFMLYNWNTDIATNGLMKKLHGINKKLYYADNTCIHINHGNVYLRSNRGHSVFSNRLTDNIYDDIYMNVDNIYWSNTDSGILHKKCLSEFNNSYIDTNLKHYNDNVIFRNYESRSEFNKLDKFIKTVSSESIRCATNILNMECGKYYGLFDRNHHLNIILVDDKLEYSNSDFMKVKNLFSRYLEIPFRFTIFQDKNYNYNFPTLFRKLLVFDTFKNESDSNLVISANIRPFKFFRTFRCIKDNICMLYNPMNKITDQSWNSDIIYYRGDYSFLYRDFIENINKYSYINLTEFILFDLLKRDIKLRNIEKYFPIKHDSIKNQNEYEYFSLLKV